VGYRSFGARPEEKACHAGGYRKTKPGRAADFERFLCGFREGKPARRTFLPLNTGDWKRAVMQYVTPLAVSGSAQGLRVVQPVTWVRTQRTGFPKMGENRRRIPWKNAMGGVAPLKFSCRVYRRGAQRQKRPVNSVL